MYYFWLTKCYEKTVNSVFKLLQKCHIIKILKSTAKKEEEIDCFIKAGKIIFNDAGVIMKTLFYQFLNLFFIYVIPYFLLISFEGKYGSFMDIITSQAILRQITAYIPSPGAAGGAEGISYFFFKNFFTKSPVVSVILIWRILTYYFNVVFGGLYLLLIRDKKIKLKNNYIKSGKAA